MMHVHGQPPFGYPCSKLTYHNYVTEREPVVYLCKRQSCRNAAVATSREGHRWPRLNLEVPYRRWEWALRRAHRELSWWSLRSLIRLSWFPGTAMYISGTNALRFWSLRPPRRSEEHTS